jgi:5-deoxy-5-amino-3-dehydroquinate synthase
VSSVRVELGARSYDVVIGPGARHELAALLPHGVQRAAIVTQKGLAGPEGAIDIDPGLDHTVIEVPRGERAKSLATLESVARSFALFGLTRSDVVIAVGGGLVTDLAGFAAATWHRGTPVVHVATTLLAQVDAAIGGKTGVNLPEGKNLVGAFWQPHAVICDTELLASLPGAEWRSGRGEVAKYEFIGAGELSGLVLEDQVRACVALKAEVVSKDEQESGRRMVLNYGHTLAHALEALGLAGDAGDLTDAGDSSPLAASAQRFLRHGEAVAVGLCFAGRLARALGRIGDDRVAQHDAVVARYELAGELPAGADRDLLIAHMRRDKKSKGDLTFMLDGPNGVEPVRGVDPAVVGSVLDEMSKEARRR